MLWSGLLYTILGLLNPLLASHIDWYWFVASQVAFGVVAGLVVVRQSRMLTRENVAVCLRAGVEAPGIIPPRGEGRKAVNAFRYSVPSRGAGAHDWACSAFGLQLSSGPTQEEFGDAGAE